MPPKGYYERLEQERQAAITRMLNTFANGDFYVVRHDKRWPTPLETEAKAVRDSAAKLNVGFSVN